MDREYRRQQRHTLRKSIRILFEFIFTERVCVYGMTWERERERAHDGRQMRGGMHIILVKHFMENLCVRVRWEGHLQNGWQHIWPWLYLHEKGVSHLQFVHFVDNREVCFYALQLMPPAIAVCKNHTILFIRKSIRSQQIRTRIWILSTSPINKHMINWKHLFLPSKPRLHHKFLLWLIETNWPQGSLR